MSHPQIDLTLIKRATISPLLKQERVYDQTLRSRIVRLTSDSRLNDRIPKYSELCITLLDDQEIQELNRDYRHKDKSTDVLSFSMLEGEVFDLPESIPTPLGDIMVSVETALKQSKKGALPRLKPHLKSDQWGLADEISFLILHGVLHLLGYDHESDAEAQEMESLEAELLSIILPQRCP